MYFGGEILALDQFNILQFLIFFLILMFFWLDVLLGEIAQWSSENE